MAISHLIWFRSVTENCREIFINEIKMQIVFIPIDKVYELNFSNNIILNSLQKSSFLIISTNVGCIHNKLES